MHLVKIVFIALFCSGFCLQGFGQRYNFEQYDIQDGLIQSQVTSIVQDQKRRLWIATLGGLSCFNGSSFVNLGKTNGMNSNFILSLALNKKDNLFIGSDRGLSHYSNGTFYNYKGHKNWSGDLVSSASGEIYGIVERRIFKTSSLKTQQVRVTADSAEMITALGTDGSGNVWAAVYQRGLFYLKNHKWHAKSLNKQVNNLIITGFLVDRLAEDKIWLLTTDGIFIAEKGQLSRVYTDIIKKGTAIAQDARGNIWLGTNKGAWYLSKNLQIHFNAKNGFTDNEVKHIFKDAENNIWLGTDGSGIFKFNSGGYVSYDESQGLQNSIVMSIINGPDPDEIWMGTYDGLFVHKNDQIKRMVIPSDNEDTRRINFLLKDSQGNIWIGTVGGGLWIYSNNRFRRIDNGSRGVACNSIMEDSSRNIWLSTNYGCFIMEHQTNKISRITGHFASSLLEIGKDSVLSGTQNGVYLIRNKKNVLPLKPKSLSGSSILSMLKRGPYILFGTADNGLVIWNRTNNAVKQLSTNDGLFSDHIYALLADSKGVIWVGTGRGINRLSSKDFSLMRNSNENALVVECNQNAILEHQNNIWIGTTKGAIVYDNTASPSASSRPYVFINSAGVLSQNKKGGQNNLQATYNENELQNTISLPYNRNHLNINFTGIYFSNPKAVLYQYRLIGLDTKFGHPTSNSSVNYTALPPGKYTFQVKAVTPYGISSANIAAFSFEITPPYYQTTIFKIFILSIIVLMIILSVYVIINLNERQRKLRLKIKLEEQFKIRKQTAEDFHDDLGNKLTRISVLSEVLNSMMDSNDTEKKAVIQKIKTNVNELYTGTKDILWSLNPKHDTLYELLSRIKEFGYEMFNETNIFFEEDLPLEDMDKRLPLELSRNILMIFKEAIHNALKHSKADDVQFIAKIDKDILEIQLEDNGTGFDLESAGNGHGINNMNVRAARINGKLDISSNQKGTTIALSVKMLAVNTLSKSKPSKDA